MSIDLQQDAIGIDCIRLHQHGQQRIQKLLEVDFREILGLVQRLMDQRHRAHAVLAIAQGRLDLRITHAQRLEVEQAVNELQIVLDAMVNLSEQ